LIEKAAELLLRSNKEEEAIKWIRKLHSAANGRRTNYASGVAVLVSHLVSKGRLTEAGDLVGSMGDPGALNRSVNLLLEAHLDEGDIERATVWSDLGKRGTLFPFPLLQKLNRAGIPIGTHPNSVLLGADREEITQGLKGLLRDEIFSSPPSLDKE
jgi:hypothetical protein